MDILKHIIKKVFLLLTFIALFLGCGKLLNYVLIDDTSSYTRIMMHQLYEPEDNIDVIFVGSSHVYRSLIPYITDEEFGCYTFNAGSSSQMMDGSLAVIKEADTYNDIKHVYLELYYGVAIDGDYESRTQHTATYIISDYMKPSLRKVDFLIHVSPKETWVNGFITARRNWTCLFNFEYMINLLKAKNSENYKDYVWQRYEGQVEYYVDRGFVANNSVVPEGTFWNAAAYSPIDMTRVRNSDWERSLNDVIKYCKRHGIELTLFVAPEPEWTLVGVGNYQEYHDYIQNIADENNLELYDFNLCSNEYLDANDRNLFKDADHLNTNGAEAFSHLFGQLHNGELQIENVFYDTYREKIEDEATIVYGIAGPFERGCFIISNRDSGLEYRIIATPSEAEQYYIQDFDRNREFSLSENETGILTVMWREEDKPAEVHTFETTY